MSVSPTWWRKDSICSHYFYEAPASFTTSFQVSKNGGPLHGSLDCSQIIASIAVISSTTIKLGGWSASRLPRQWFLSLAASSASHSVSDSPLLDVTLPPVSLKPLQGAVSKQEALKPSDLVRCCSCPRLLVNFESQVILYYWLSVVNFCSSRPACITVVPPVSTARWAPRSKARNPCILHAANYAPGLRSPRVAPNCLRICPSFISNNAWLSPTWTIFIFTFYPSIFPAGSRERFQKSELEHSELPTASWIESRCSFETGSQSISTADLGLLILLPLPPQCWNYRYSLPWRGEKRDDPFSAPLPRHTKDDGQESYNQWWQFSKRKA